MTSDKSVPESTSVQMSDYMFMLENHLSAEQNQVVAEVQSGGQPCQPEPLSDRRRHARHAGRVSQVRDLDFAVEGNALKVAKAVAEKTGARIVSHRRKPPSRRS